MFIQTLLRKKAPLKSKRHPTLTRGFTIVELLLVISMVGLMSSVALAATKHARARAGDARQVLAASELSRAVRMYIDDTGVAPMNFGNVGAIAWNDDPKTLDGNTKNAFDKSMDQLISKGVIRTIPTPASSNVKIGYLDHGKGSSYGAIIYTTRVTVPSVTSTGGMSCRIAGNNSYTSPINPSLMSNFTGMCPSGYQDSAALIISTSSESNVLCSNASGQTVLATGSGGASDPVTCYPSIMCASGWPPSFQPSTSCSDSGDGNATYSISVCGQSTLYDMNTQSCTGTSPNKDYCMCNPY